MSKLAALKAKNQAKQGAENYGCKISGKAILINNYF